MQDQPIINTENIQQYAKIEFNVPDLFQIKQSYLLSMNFVEKIRPVINGDIQP